MIGMWVGGAANFSDGDVGGYVTIFGGPKAEQRARDYGDALKRGLLATRLAEDANAH